MVVRGAPAIGVAGGLRLALAAGPRRGPRGGVRACCSPRPGRRRSNLVWALDADARRPDRRAGAGAPRGEVERCRRMAAHAVELFAPGARVAHALQRGRARDRRLRHGASARSARAWERGLVAHVWVDETRPLLQGARLTAWELEGLGVPFAVLADAAAASLMAAGRSTASSPAPTGSRRTATPPTRSARTRWPCSRAHHGDPALRRGADVDGRPRDARPAPGSRSRSATRPR